MNEQIGWTFYSAFSYILANERINGIRQMQRLMAATFQRKKLHASLHYYAGEVWSFLLNFSNLLSLICFADLLFFTSIYFSYLFPLVFPDYFLFILLLFPDNLLTVYFPFVAR